MNYQILARKWRPQSFKDIIGQKYIITAILNGLLLGKIHHGWLFYGTRGIGKTTIARLIAKSLNCVKGITPYPCGKCIICKEIEQTRCPDVIEIDAASRTKVEDMREILDSIFYSPIKTRFKIYLIDEVHMLSRNSFNSLLKTLEEPPEHVKFILATTDIEKIPKTIISRCLCFNLQTLSEEKIFNFLKKILNIESIKYDDQSLKVISHYAKGSIRDALNLLECAISLGKNRVCIKNVVNMLQIPTEEQAFLLTDALLKKETKQMMRLLYEIVDTGVDWEEILTAMLRILYYISMSKLFPLKWEQGFINTYKHKINNLGKLITHQDIQLCYKMLLNGKKELIFAPNNQIGVEMTLIQTIKTYKNKTFNK
ncbi:MAG: DNA polymerase III subunit gamma/tau [Buchnera aphidicola (Pentalonia nigronervosa)]|uniref:DNA polymerase III subunit gamma/tau n=1 Tax=Buchnera aphidicola (Pentalonia nigronervosa) TaxID=1309793 RepID=A0A7H1AYV8_9GAMM|nr:MAG: DNA polymerase III subunit gamma/tau [Buchnera aphidicola (Pentalonia nigronervosa)]